MTKSKIPKTMQSGDSQINNPKETANLFNKHFCSIGRVLGSKYKIKNADSNDFCKYLHNHVTKSMCTNSTQA